MPERPDLEWVVPELDRELRGSTIVDAHIKKPVILRCLVSELRGTIAGVQRRAHFVLFDLGAKEMVISPMLAGRFQLDGKATSDLALELMLEDGRVLRYRDDKAMGKVYLVNKGDWAKVPGLANVGVDVLSPAFTLECFLQLARPRLDQVRVFLMDRTALDAMGNAYADEVLWEAQIYPKRRVRELSEDELRRLHAAIVKVIGDSSRVIRERQPPLPEKLRDFLHVRGRKGEACDRCGSTLRVTGVHGYDSTFCPRCQPDVKGRGLVDWTRVH